MCKSHTIALLNCNVAAHKGYRHHRHPFLFQGSSEYKIWPLHRNSFVNNVFFLDRYILKRNVWYFWPHWTFHKAVCLIEISDYPQIVVDRKTSYQFRWPKLSKEQTISNYWLIYGSCNDWSVEKYMFSLGASHLQLLHQKLWSSHSCQSEHDKRLCLQPLAFLILFC